MRRSRALAGALVAALLVLAGSITCAQELRDEIRAREVESPKLKGAEDLPTRPAGPQGRRQTALSVELHFSTPMASGQWEVLLDSATTAEGALFRAALSCGLAASRKGGVSVQDVSCGRVRDDEGCWWWCCTDREDYSRTCELIYCDAKPAPPRH